MVEMTTGQRPFNNYKFDIDLVIKIYNGLRPKFGPGIPDCYIELANQCMGSDPEKRPTSSEIIIKLNEWLVIVNDEWIDIIGNEAEKKIKSQFLESDEFNKNFSTIKENLKNIYTSKAYNLTEINKSLSKLKISKPVGTVEVPDI
ncbi:hypothetical protein C2G38_2055253 [Gigaspora rosea]|uniref:Protein kinase domain-containing protein n=1 Tax=Gigaspora rosea TaxID=44941 RepID=A0A397WCP3_9GLOM|nr:hypothetical protein C2G38_2055253 [Gigaspora rosea]